MIISTQVLLIIKISLIVILLPTFKTTKPKQNHEPCSPFPYATLENGNITSIGTQKYMFKCNPGYYLASPPQVRCWKGKWSSLQKPTCSKIEGQCDDPPPIHGGKILGDLKYIGSIINYICDPGFILMGDRMRTCESSGHWSGITPTCMDESEPVQNVAERLKKDFVIEMGSHSSDSTMVMAKALDANSVKNGLELIILIDRSSSIDPKDFKLGIDFIKFLLAEFGVRNGNNTTGTRAAVLTFGNNVDIVFNLDDKTIIGPQAASRALDNIQPNGGGTAMQQAIMSVFTFLPPLRPKAKKALFMITDGEPNIGEEEDTLFFADELKNKEDYEIFTVGIGKGINRQLLSKLASEPLISHVFILENYAQLRSMMDVINDKSNRPKPISPALCGYIKHEKHFLKNWPWLAAIYVNRPGKENKNHLRFCSGTLICSQWVITAASCFYHEHENNVTKKEFEQVTKEVFVSLGERDLMNEERNQHNFYAESIVIHPDFQPIDTLENNLALIKLNAKAPKKRFRPACLPPLERNIQLHLDLNVNASIAGWGQPPSKDNEWEITGSSVHFRSSNISATLEEESVCRRFSKKADDTAVFCAGGHGVHTCIGDIGSPIVAVDPASRIHHLIGVLVKRSHCKQGINQYAELTKFVSWINETTINCHSQHYMV